MAECEVLRRRKWELRMCFSGKYPFVIGIRMQLIKAEIHKRQLEVEARALLSSPTGSDSE